MLGGKQGGPLHQAREGPRCGVQSGTKRSALQSGGVQAVWGRPPLPRAFPEVCGTYLLSPLGGADPSLFLVPPIPES